uniref:Transmembrane protein n=1 Tax=Medicago truncatula TaxID=3880 RepID=I3S2E5_MEDTR|nr:unknown [Medicago truncatula]
MWFTMPQTMSLFVLRLWLRVPLSKLMLHHSSSGIFSTTVLKLVGKRKQQPRRILQRRLKLLLKKLRKVAMCGENLSSVRKIGNLIPTSKSSLVVDVCLPAFHHALVNVAGLMGTFLKAGSWSFT